jgi:cytochrome oxidase Cu insertion factor (SCO1/SenC/PrrC family)
MGPCAFHNALFAEYQAAVVDDSSKPGSKVETSAKSLSKLEPCERKEEEGATSKSLHEGITRTPWIDPQERTRRFPTGYSFQNHENQIIKSEKMVGKPFALTFLYTRCSNVYKCPAVAAKMAQLQVLAKETGIENQLRLFVVTYDPEFDSTATIQEYSEEHGLSLNSNFMFLRPPSDHKKDFFEELEATVNFKGPDVNLHGIQLYLFDRNGLQVRTYHSMIWNNHEVVKDLIQLTQEK